MKKLVLMFSCLIMLFSCEKNAETDVSSSRKLTSAFSSTETYNLSLASRAFGVQKISNVRNANNTLEFDVSSENLNFRLITQGLSTFNKAHIKIVNTLNSHEVAMVLPDGQSAKLVAYANNTKSVDFFKNGSLIFTLPTGKQFEKGSFKSKTDENIFLFLVAMNGEAVDASIKREDTRRARKSCAVMTVGTTAGSSEAQMADILYGMATSDAFNANQCVSSSYETSCWSFGGSNPNVGICVSVTTFICAGGCPN